MQPEELLQPAELAVRHTLRLSLFSDRQDTCAGSCYRAKWPAQASTRCDLHRGIVADALAFAAILCCPHIDLVAHQCEQDRGENRNAVLTEGGQVEKTIALKRLV